MNSFYMKPDKPDSDDVGKSYLKYHCFNRTSRWTAMSFELHPEDVSLSLKVYLKTGGKPDVRAGDFNLQYDLPDFKSCDVDVDKRNASEDNETVFIDPFIHCTRHPYSLFISNVDFNETGEHCFAVQVQNVSVDYDPYQASGKSRRKRSFACDIGKRRMRRSCIVIPPPPPKPPTESPFTVLFADNLGFDGQYFFPNQTPNYNMSMYESSCLYWDEENQTWTGHGCRVGPLTSRSNIQCFCNHLTSFGSDLVVAPNPIDFNSVLNNFGSLQDNVAVLALISTVLGLYILGVLWGRRADKRDDLMIGPTILSNPHGSYHYLVTIYTGNRPGSGTSAKVFFKMVGDDDETVPVKLWDAKRPCFERGQENQFIVSYSQEVGELSYVQIWHNNAGVSPSWYLSRLSVKDIQTNKQWYFVCDNWLAVEAEDGKVCRVLPVANDQELTNFNQLFTARTVKGLADGHLWFSIFSRPPSSNFTRVQRLSCCLCLLCCTMITSAMFYNMGGDGPSPFSIQIGSLVIDLKQFVIALQSSLIIVPVNVAIVQIFRNLRPKPSKKDIYKEEKEDNNEKEESAGEKPKGKLPYWFIYVAYLLCYLASAASIFFTLLYSIQWGKEKSTEWVIAMVTAFLQSVLLLQPVKVLVLAIVLAVFVRKPADVDDQDDTPVTYEPPKTVSKRRRKSTNRLKIYSPPDPETLKEARVKRLKEIKMNSIIKEIATFFIFLIMLLNVAYYHRDPNTFLMTKTLYETFDEVDAFSIDLGAVSDGDSLWMWARETLVPGLYAKEWYNGKKIQKGFIANMEHYLVGVPRMRQIPAKWTNYLKTEYPIAMTLSLLLTRRLKRSEYPGSRWERTRLENAETSRTRR
ncbi:polycystic kidney disease protein 1-like 2 isoform X2 [Dendronephthya gigantea]|uniref:polycystic kidney disease protein 1-like 2 isoform X2 n=1 Tax=Dendronephthya gigantea TaxID=151771 RepID=UPI00106CBA6F|nr:polycystic kidney disease protein 1-like 2 isoform X2 [Dendronephthya gigantea]